MTNEQYLIVSYFLVGLFSFGLGLAAYGLLRRPFDKVTKELATLSLSQMLRRLFAVGIILPAMAGFLSVSYPGCEARSYEKIVSNRAYIVDKNREQISSTFDFVRSAMLVWMSVVTVSLAVVRCRSTDPIRRSEGGERNTPGAM